MGIFKEIFTVLSNYFPDKENHDALFHQFYDWLADEEKNMMFVPSTRIGYYFDLCNETEIPITECCEYWCKEVKLNNKSN